MVCTVPLKRRFLALLKGKKSYQEVSDKQWTLCASESYFSPSALYLDGQLDKVTAVAETTTYEEEMRRIQGGISNHGATTAHLLRDAYVLDGYVYKDAAKYGLVATKEELIGPEVASEIPDAALACSFIGNRYFGDWMIGDLPLTLAARELSEPITVKQSLSNHQVEYCNIFDIHAIPVSRVKCGELIIIDDLGQNSFKRKRYEYLRSRLQALEPLEPRAGVMLLRGTSGAKRLLVNEEEIADYLESLGFAILDPLKLSATEIVRRSLGAKIIVGVMGSQLMPAFLSLAEGGSVLCLQPPYQFDNCYKIYADCLNMKYGFVVGEEMPDGFRVDLAELEKTLEKFPLY